MIFFYTLCLVVGLLFTLVSAVAGHFFGAHDVHHLGTGGHAESGFDDSGIPGISFFSPLVLACFVTAFGGLGILFSDIPATREVWLSAPFSAAGALCIALFVLWLFNLVFSRTQSSSESRVSTLKGQVGTLTTPIPAAGVGEIAYVQGGTRYTAPARTENGAPVAQGQAVRIVRIVGTQFFVEPANFPSASSTSTDPKHV